MCNVLLYFINSHFSRVDDIQILSRLSLAIDVFPLRVAMVSHAVRERSNLGSRPIFPQEKSALQQIDLFAGCFSMGRE